MQFVHHVLGLARREFLAGVDKQHVAARFVRPPCSRERSNTRIATGMPVVVNSLAGSPTTASSRFSSISVWRMRPSAPPRNNTPWGTIFPNIRAIRGFVDMALSGELIDRPRQILRRHYVSASGARQEAAIPPRLARRIAVQGGRPVFLSPRERNTTSPTRTKYLSSTPPMMQTFAGSSKGWRARLRNAACKLCNCCELWRS